MAGKYDTATMGSHPVPRDRPNLPQPAGASILTVCVFRWLNQSLLSWLEKLLKGFSGLWIPSSGGSHKEMEECPPTWLPVPGSSQPTLGWSSAEPSPSQLA